MAAIPSLRTLDALTASGRARLKLARALHEPLLHALEILSEALANGRTLFVFGNDALLAEAALVGAAFARFRVETSALPRAARGEAGDVALILTTGDDHDAVAKLASAERDRRVATIIITDPAGARLRTVCDACLPVPGNDDSRPCDLRIGIALALGEGVRSAPNLADEVGSSSSDPAPEKELGLEVLCSLRETWREQGKVVVWTNGCFDLLHPGHLASFRAARSFGDVLVVGVNADASIQRAKGPGRPVFPLSHRVAMLSALEDVDYVLPFEEPTPAEVLARLRPDVHCKGRDYATPGATLPEREIVERYGGRIEFLDLVPGVSSSEWVRRIQSLPPAAK
jgi:rfaE bifunctional protein nucleotidyltransferase chain/domain